MPRSTYRHDTLVVDVVDAVAGPGNGKAVLLAGGKAVSEELHPHDGLLLAGEGGDQLAAPPVLEHSEKAQTQSGQRQALTEMDKPRRVNG